MGATRFVDEAELRPYVDGAIIATVESTPYGF
jgi:hypothetical protein